MAAVAAVSAAGQTAREELQQEANAAKGAAAAAERARAGAEAKVSALEGRVREADAALRRQAGGLAQASQRADSLAAKPRRVRP